MLFVHRVQVGRSGACGEHPSSPGVIAFFGACLLRQQLPSPTHITMDESGWCLTESDPQVFSELLRELGVTGLQVVSVLSGSATLLLW